MSEKEIVKGEYHDMTCDELRRELEKIASHCEYKSFGDGRIRSPEKEKMRLKYARENRKTIKHLLEDKRSEQANDAIKSPGKNAGENGVYVMESMGLYKIGQTKNIENRLSDIRTSNPHGVQLLEYTKVECAEKVEEKYHDIYDEKRVSGEWFNLSKSELDEVLKSLQTRKKEQ